MFKGPCEREEGKYPRNFKALPAGRSRRNPSCTSRDPWTGVKRSACPDQSADTVLNPMEQDLSRELSLATVLTMLAGEQKVSLSFSISRTPWVGNLTFIWKWASGSEFGFGLDNNKQSFGINFRTLILGRVSPEEMYFALWGFLWLSIPRFTFSYFLLPSHSLSAPSI